MLNWFRRNKTEAPDMPPELGDYYKTERRQRLLRTLLLSFVTLVMTFVIAFALFLVGRWGYRQIAGDPESTPPSGVEQAQPTSVDVDTPPSDGDVQVTTLSDNESNGQVRVVNGNETEETEETQETTETTETTTNLPDSGPGETLAVFVVASLAGVLGHNLYNRRKSYKP